MFNNRELTDDELLADLEMRSVGVKYRHHVADLGSSGSGAQEVSDHEEDGGGAAAVEE